MLEHIYTASPKGLDPNRSGFVTVAYTNGFPPNLISPLENLSGYKALDTTGNPQGEANPANYSFQHYGTGSSSWYIVSRITYAGPSYTGRSNNLAHHLLFSREELTAIPGGASAVLADERNWVPYNGVPGLLPVRRCHYEASTSVREGATWARLCGSADWAHVVAERFREDRTKGVVLQFTPGGPSVTDILSLVSEVVTWLTPEEAADFTFSTYCYQSAIGNPVFFRVYTADSPYLASARRLNPQGVIVLGEKNLFGADEDRLLRIYRERVRRAAEVARERSAMERRRGAEKRLSAEKVDSEWGGASISASISSGESALPGEAQGILLSTQKHSSTADRHGEPRRFLTRFLVVIAVLAVLGTLCLGTVFFWPQISAFVFKDRGQKSVVPEKDLSTSESAVVPEVSTPVQPEESASAVAMEVPEVVEEVVEEESATELAGSLQFFEDFLLSRKNTIPLPTRFAAGGVISVEVSKIGEKDKGGISAESGALSQSDENRCVVYPLEETDDANGLSRILVVAKHQPENQLVLEIAGGKLKIQEPGVGEMQPRRDNITQIAVDNAELFVRAFTPAMKDRLASTETVTGEVDLTQDGRLVGKASCSDRLLKYRDFVHLMASALRWNKSIYSEIPVELDDIGHEINILNLEEAREFNRGCQSLPKLKNDLMNMQNMLGQCFKGVQEEQTITKEVQNVKQHLQFFANKEVKVRESKKKTQKYQINLEGIAMQVRSSLEKLQKRFYAVGERNSQVSNTLFVEEFVELEHCRQELRDALKKMDNEGTQDREGYKGDCQHIRYVITEIEAVAHTAQMWLKTRLGYEKNISECEKEIQRTVEEIARARSVLASKLQGILSPESYGKNFKMTLEGDGCSPIDLEMLRGELQKECTLEFHLELR